MKTIATLLLLLASAAAAQERSVALDELRDKVRGAWAGKMIGVSYGFPTEFRHLGTIVPPDKLPVWKPEMVREALKQDDLYVQMTYSEVLDARGLDATTADFAAMLRQSRYPLWHTSQAARRALRRGARIEDLGTPITSAHGEDISFQIINDFLGLSCPGMPRTAMELSDRVSAVAAWGDGACAGRFVAGMYAAAYFETNARKIIEAALASVPADSEYARAIRDVLEWHRRHPDDWQKTWSLLNEKYDHQDRCSFGALHPLNIDARINGGYTAIGLLYGGDDFSKVLEIATRCGQDSDCNPCTACGVWAAARGYAKIPPQYTQDIESIADEEFIFTNSSFNSAVENTIKRAIVVASAFGGRVEGDRLIVREQQPEATPVRDFPDASQPVERIGADNARWSWSGNWQEMTTQKAGVEKFSGDKDAEATIKFTGTGAIIVGAYMVKGGQADIYLDGKLDRTVDVFSDSDDRRVSMEDVWHKFGLADGKHTLRLVVRGERFGDSKGTQIHIQSLVVFR